MTDSVKWNKSRATPPKENGQVYVVILQSSLSSYDTRYHDFDWDDEEAVNGLPLVRTVLPAHVLDGAFFRDESGTQQIENHEILEWAWRDDIWNNRRDNRNDRTKPKITV